MGGKMSLCFYLTLCCHSLTLPLPVPYVLSIQVLLKGKKMGGKEETMSFENTKFTQCCLATQWCNKFMLPMPYVLSIQVLPVGCSQSILPFSISITYTSFSTFLSSSDYFSHWGYKKYVHMQISIVLDSINTYVIPQVVNVLYLDMFFLFLSRYMATALCKPSMLNL